MKPMRSLVLGVASLVILLAAATTLSHTLAQDTTPTPNPLPAPSVECQAYHVTVNAANIRACAASSCRIVEQAQRNTVLCVRGQADTSEWLQVDLAPDDPASPIYFVSASVVAAGPPGQSQTDAATCQPYLVEAAQTALYSCAQTSCSVLGILTTEQWLCVEDFSGQYPGWAYAVYSDADTSGWVQLADLVISTSSPLVVRTGVPPTTTVTPGGAPRATNTPIVPTITPRDGPITLSGAVPACQQYHVTIDQAAVRRCAGAGCAVETLLAKNQVVCIRGITDNPQWLIVDLVPEDTTSPLFAIEAKLVAPGAEAVPQVILDCEPWEVIAPVDANLRDCPSLTCNIIGTLNNGEWGCARSFGGAYNDWVLLDIPNGPSGVWISAEVVREMAITGTPTSAPIQVAQLDNTTPTVVAATTTASPSQQPAAAPVCQIYAVNVPAANVRGCPSTDCAIIARLEQNAPVCVIGPAPFLETSWYIIDLDPSRSDDAQGFISQNLVVAATPGPGTPVAAATNPATETPAGPPTATLTPTPFVTLLPTPIFTAAPESLPSTPILARDVFLSTLRVLDKDLFSPLGEMSFQFQLPDDWYMDGNNVLYLSLNYFESLTSADQSNWVSTLTVRLDSQLISSVTLNNTVIGPQTLAIALPLAILSQEGGSHRVSLAFDARDFCLSGSQARLTVDADQSYFHFEYREVPPVLDLALYPRPLYNGRFSDDIETVLIVLPLEPTYDDFQVAARLSAGLGRLTAQGLQINVVTAEDITEQERRDNHLLLVGRVGTNPLIDELYAADLFPTKLNAQGLLEVNNAPIEENDGVVQMIINPQNAMRAIVAVTGQTTEAFYKAAQALSGPPSILGLGGPLALVADVRPLSTVPQGTVIETDITFTQLGYPQITLGGAGELEAQVEFAIPLGETLSDEAYVDLIFNYSEVMHNGRTSLALLLNDTTPLYSTLLGNIEGDTQAVQGPQPLSSNQIRAWIPPSGIVPGQTNTLNISVNVQGEWRCYPPDATVSWFTVSGDSLLHLPRQVAEQAVINPLVGWFPIPFNLRADLGDVWISLPDQPSRRELEQAFELLAALGAAIPNGEGFQPRLTLGAPPADADLSQYHFIVLGRPSTNSFLPQLNPYLPQPFIENTDQLAQVLDDINFRLPADYEMGVLQTFVSPWSTERVILVATGTGANSQINAADALLSDNYWGGDYLGDVVFIRDQTVSAIDTRLLRQPVEPAVVSGAEAATETPAPSLTAPAVTPVPLVTPVVTATPAGSSAVADSGSAPLLAKEVVLANLRVNNMQMTSPLGSASFRFRLPTDWVLDGQNMLYLNVEYSESLPAQQVPAESAPNASAVQLVSLAHPNPNFAASHLLQKLSSTLEVEIDGQLVTSFILDSSSTQQPQTLAVKIPNTLLVDTQRDHTARLTLRGREYCLKGGLARAFIRSDQSFFHFEFRELPPALDLALYPRPFYNQRFTDDLEAVIIVLPPDPTNDDLQVVARLAAGLGNLSFRSVQINVIEADELTEQQQRDNNLLLVGQVGTNPLIDALYAADLWPTTLSADGVIQAGDLLLSETDGVIQMVINPLNSRRAIVAVTGQTPQAVFNAAQALAGPPSMLGIDGPLAVVEEAQPPVYPAAAVVNQLDPTFADLGVTDLTLSDIGTLYAEVSFTIPLGQQLTNDAYIDLAFNYSDLLHTGQTTVALLLNSNTPLASVVLGQPGQTDGPQPNRLNHLQAWLPPASVLPGQTNTLSIVVNVEGEWGCYPPDPAASWFTISGKSMFYLPRTAAQKAPQEIPLVGRFPLPFNALPDLSDVWIALPDQPTQLELTQAFRLVALLGSTVTGGEAFKPGVHIGQIPPETDLAQYNLIVIGRPTTSLFLASLNANLPQPFVPGTDELEQKLDDVSYRLLPGYEIGVLQTIVSPWSPQRTILVITGTGATGQNNAINILLSEDYFGDDLLGDVVFVRDNTALAVDTRNLEEGVELLTSVPELATEAAFQSSLTPPPSLVYTVTPGPTLTFTPTNTLGPTRSPTPILTFTPVPTVPTPLPTFVPLTAEQIAATKPKLPAWFDILLGATALTIGVIVIFGGIQWLRQGRKRNV